MAEEIIFKVGVDTGDSVQDVNKVGDAINGVDKEAKKTSGSFVNLKKELRQLTIQLQGLDPASKEFEQVAQRAGKIKEQLRGVADAINDADPEKFGGKFQRTAEGIAGAFSAVTGAQALFGKNSEEIEKQMLKVQGAIALTQGISAMKELKNDGLELANSIKSSVVNAFKSLTTAEIVNAQATGTMTALQKAYAFSVGTSTGAMKAFRLALLATGIGALVMLVGFLVEKMLTYTSSTKQAELAQKKFNDTMEKQNTIIERNKKNLQDSSNFQLEYAKAVGASEGKILEIQKKGIADRDLQRKQELFLIDDQIKELRKRYISAFVDEDFERAKEIEKQIQDKQKLKSDLISEEYSLQRELTLLNANFQHDQDVKRIEKHKKELADIHQNNLKKIELENARILEQETLENEYYDSLKTQQELEVQAVRDKYNKIIETTTENETLLLARQKELDAISLKYKEQNALTESQRLDAIGQQYEDFVTQYTETTNTASENEKLSVEAKYFDLIEKAKAYNKEAGAEIFKIVDLEKARATEIKAIDNELLQAKQKFTDEVSNMLGALAGAFAQGSKIQKAFAVAQVAVDTAKAISSVIAGATAAAAAGGPAAPFLIGGYIASGIASVTKAFTSVNNILKQPLPSVQPPTMNRPNDNVNTTNKTQQTQTIQAQSTYKVVVVDSDITNMQNKTKKVQAISTI